MARPRYISRYPQYQFGTHRGIVLNARLDEFKWDERLTLEDLVDAGFVPDKIEAHRIKRKLVVCTRGTKQILNLDLLLRDFYVMRANPKLLKARRLTG